MFDLPSKADIDKISLEILKGSKTLDVFPTPIDQIVSYADLLVRNDIDVSKIHHGFFSKANDALRRAVKKVRGLLDRREKTIYLDLSQLNCRQNFVKLHETGHGVLPWQKKIYDIIDDDDDSLSPYITEEFEAEANYFSSVTLFQHDRFMAELNKLPLGLNGAMQLSKHFGSSVHAALRKYVESSKNRCALIVLENISAKGKLAECTLRNFFPSQSFTETFGFIQLPGTLGYEWPFVRDYYFKRRFKTDGKLSLTTENGETDFVYHFFNNQYNAFVFLFPVGEKKRSRTNIIIKQSY
jgi:hypothetical protein